MTTYDWHHTYRQAVETFNGSTPGAELEQTLLEEFQHSPQTVTAAINKAATGYKAGTITSPWGIVRTELARVSAQPHIEVTDTRNREKTIANAEAWIRTTGLHLTENEIVSHLFAPLEHTAPLDFLEDLEQETRDRPGRPLYEGLLLAVIRRTRELGPEPIPGTGGPLSDHDTPALRQRMTALWAEQQVRATQLEAEAYERAEKWKTQQAAIKAARARAATEAPPPRRFPPANETYFEPTTEAEHELPPPDETTYDPSEEPT